MQAYSKKTNSIVLWASREAAILKIKFNWVNKKFNNKNGQLTTPSVLENAQIGSPPDVKYQLITDCAVVMGIWGGVSEFGSLEKGHPRCPYSQL